MKPESLDALERKRVSLYQCEICLLDYTSSLYKIIKKKINKIYKRELCKNGDKHKQQA